MKNKGFTLVELLSVIVILAVISLIATPMILGVIETTKKSALKESANALVEEAGYYYMQYGVDNNVRFDIENNEINKIEGNALLLKGNIKDATVLINTKGEVALCINDGGYSVYKNYRDNKLIEVDNKNCNIPTGQAVVFLENESTIREYTNEELTTLITSLQEQIQVSATTISNLEQKIISLENSTDGNPTGTVISYIAGSTAPNGYLPCDGAIYNIADYPALATAIKNGFGSYNYYGGDGTTTFAVPDLRGEFLRGTGTNSHENQGNGSNIGVHQDSTTFPAYFQYATDNRVSFRYDYGVLGTSGDYGVKNHDKLVNSVGTIKAINVSGTTGGTSMTGASYNVRPTNTSVLYCIKY